MYHVLKCQVPLVALPLVMIIYHRSYAGCLGVLVDNRSRWLNLSMLAIVGVGSGVLVW